MNFFKIGKRTKSKRNRKNKIRSKKMRKGGDPLTDAQKYKQEQLLINQEKYKKNMAKRDENIANGTYLAPLNKEDGLHVIQSPELLNLQRNFEGNMGYEEAKLEGLTIGGKTRSRTKRNRKRIMRRRKTI